MAVVKLEPTDEHPVPYDVSDEKPSTVLDEVAVAGNTAEMQVALGAPLEVSVEDEAREDALHLLDQVAPELIAEHLPLRVRQPLAR